MTTRQEFEALVQSTWPRVFAFARVLNTNRADAEDVAAQTFERAYRAWQRGTFPDGDAVPWLLLVARRLTADSRRRRSLLQWLPLRSVAEPNQADRTYDDIEAVDWFRHLEEVLPRRQFEVLVLRYLSDIPDSEIGRAMGLSEAGVRSLVFRAQASLRRHPEVLKR